MGPRTTEFERLFVEYTGAGDAIAVSSGTAALHLACLVAGLGPGDEVIVPSLTFVATVNAIVYTGARPVFVDIAAVDKPWLSVTACEMAISDRARAVLAVAFGGHCGEIIELRSLCARAACSCSRTPLMLQGLDFTVAISVPTASRLPSACSPTRTSPWAKVASSSRPTRRLLGKSGSCDPTE